MIIKNSNLRRNLFGNRYKILAVIIAIILILAVIHVLNERAKNELESSHTNIKESTTYNPQETVILGQDVTDQKQEVNDDVISTFIELCNKKQVESAFDLLTEECKELIFDNSLEKFKKNYIETKFATPKTYNMQSWINSQVRSYI